VIIDPKDLNFETVKDVLRRKPIVQFSFTEKRPSGFTDEEPMTWDRFLAAWHMDRAPGSLNGSLIESLKVFILTWRLKGRGGYTIPINLRNPNDEHDVVTIECETEQLPDITYNPDGYTDIEQLVMPYRLWMDAVADLKYNLAGPSAGTEEAAKHEHLHWGGPVDVSKDINPIGMDPNDPMNKVFDL
jgi:hypothetical protein